MAQGAPSLLKISRSAILQATEISAKLQSGSLLQRHAFAPELPPLHPTNIPPACQPFLPPTASVRKRLAQIFVLLPGTQSC